MAKSKKKANCTTTEGAREEGQVPPEWYPQYCCDPLLTSGRVVEQVGELMGERVREMVCWRLNREGI